jgi:hypothetical protein
MKIDYDRITNIGLEYTCVGISARKHEELMKGAVRANKRRIDRLVKKFYPELYDELSLRLRNPYDYYRTDKHLILVHSAIEYFFRFYY